MTVLVAIVGVALGGLVAVGFLAGLLTRPSMLLGRVESQLSALRRDIAGYRSAHENQTSSFDRRLLGLEQTTARAANEVRMVSDQVLAQVPTDQPVEDREVG